MATSFACDQRFYAAALRRSVGRTRRIWPCRQKFRRLACLPHLRHQYKSSNSNNLVVLLWALLVPRMCWEWLQQAFFYAICSSCQISNSNFNIFFTDLDGNNSAWSRNKKSTNIDVGSLPTRALYGEQPNRCLWYVTNINTIAHCIMGTIFSHSLPHSTLSLPKQLCWDEFN